jgi:hypothetical protein
MVAGLEFGRTWRVPRKSGCWYPVPRASGFAGFPFGALLSADLTHSSINEALQLAGVRVGILFLDTLHGTMKDAPADSFFDEFRAVAFFHAL